jgi:hypothetical protein
MLMECEVGVATRHKFENVLPHKGLADLLILSFCNLLYLPTALVGKTYVSKSV